jgi:hypothetical protein
MTVLIGITNYQDFDYTARAARTALAHTPDSKVVIVDDASPNWPDRLKKGPDWLPEQFREWYNHDRVYFVQFSDNVGLTRSWNHIAWLGDHSDAFDYTVISNNDVVFTPGWFDAVKWALDNGYDVASPITNAPGPTAKGLQDVVKYVEDYRLTDDDDYLGLVAADLQNRGLVYKPVEARVNGYCWAAKSKTWLKYAYDRSLDQAFNPRNTHNSKGRPNATPTMTLMEDEYQHRMYAQGGKSAVCPGSFVFHYRSVWRGDKYKQGRWYRPSEGKP